MFVFRSLLPALFLFPLAASLGHAAKEPVVLKVGDKAPTFTGKDDSGKEWDSEQHAGKKIYVVYFYPADMTPGCTTQACSYRDSLADLQSYDVEVIGISGDTVENHQHFKQEHELNFTLLADPDGKIAKAFGVKTSEGGSIEREIEGETVTLERGVTAGRWTFVIDKEWRIAYKNTKVNPVSDSVIVLTLVEKLKR